MTAVMLATYPEMFAAGAVIAGLAYGSASSMTEAFGAMSGGTQRSASLWGDHVRDASSHESAWPTISIWHGTQDATVRPAAGEALLQQWIDVHDVAGGPETAITPDGRAYEVWSTPDERPVVEMHRISGMAHGTPLKTDDAGTAGAFLLDVGVSSSLEIARTWGLASAAPQKARKVAGREARATVLREEIVAPVPANPITAVIENALRTAGLMR